MKAKIFISSFSLILMSFLFSCDGGDKSSSTPKSFMQKITSIKADRLLQRKIDKATFTLNPYTLAGGREAFSEEFDKELPLKFLPAFKVSFDGKKLHVSLKPDEIEKAVKACRYSYRLGIAGGFDEILDKLIEIVKEDAFKKHIAQFKISFAAKSLEKGSKLRVSFSSVDFEKAMESFLKKSAVKAYFSELYKKEPHHIDMLKLSFSHAVKNLGMKEEVKDIEFSREGHSLILSESQLS